MDPGQVPIGLSRLTNLESLLIARVHPMMSVYRVKGQQYKYSGNVINFAQDVNMIAPTLPYKPADLSAILIVKRGGYNASKEFVVRREYVCQALVWLQKNHIYYQDVSIIHDTIDELPENGIPTDLPHVDEESNGTSQGDQDAESNGPPELHLEDFHIDEFQAVRTVAAPVQPN
ncbi:hypothetical protein ACHQM5_017825 [Ranunculus cassubicifolius]